MGNWRYNPYKYLNGVTTLPTMGDVTTKPQLSNVQSPADIPYFIIFPLHWLVHDRILVVAYNPSITGWVGWFFRQLYMWNSWDIYWHIPTRLLTNFNDKQLRKTSPTYFTQLSGQISIIPKPELRKFWGVIFLGGSQKTPRNSTKQWFFGWLFQGLNPCDWMSCWKEVRING